MKLRGIFKSPTLFAVLVVILFLVSSVLTLADYGLAWDESLGNAFFGERYLFYFRTFDDNYLDFDHVPATLANRALDLSQSTWRNQPNVFPPFADTVSAATLHLFGYSLKWLNPIDAFHLAGVLFAAALLIALFFFLKKRLGAVVALVALIALATYPRFWGDAHFNIKDVPETALMAFAIFSYVIWYEKPHWLKAVLFGFLFGLATLTKINAVFIPIIVVLGLWGSKLHLPKNGNIWASVKPFLLHHLVMVIAAFHTILLGWPLVNKDFGAFVEYVTRFIGQGQRSGPAYFQWETIRLTFATMPEYFVLLLVLGIIASIYLFVKEKNHLYRLLLVWCLLPVIRIALPGMSNFDGIRHYLEFLPAAAALAGVGFFALHNWLKRFPKPVTVIIPVLLVLLAAANLVDAYISYRPFEYLYYNRISGGTAGAVKTFGRDAVSDYWAVSYRQGMEWLNENSQNGSALYTSIGGEIVAISKNALLRTDISLVGDEASALDSEGPTYIMFINRPAFFKSLEKTLVKKGEPVFTLENQGQVLLYIYKR